jgi:hypothetical protein
MWVGASEPNLAKSQMTGWRKNKEDLVCAGLANKLVTMMHTIAL